MAIDLANLPNKTALTLAGTDQIFVNSGGVASDVSVSALTAYVGAAVQPAIDALESELAAPSGAAGVGFDGGTAQDVLDSAKPMQSYTALRAYTGRATSVRITTPGIAGFFLRDSDVVTADNGGTVIVDASGRRWFRLYDGTILLTWFGAVGNATGVTGVGADDSAAIEAALSASTSVNDILIQPGKTYRVTRTLVVVGNKTFRGPDAGTQGFQPAYIYHDSASTGPLFNVTYASSGVCLKNFTVIGGNGSFCITSSNSYVRYEYIRMAAYNGGGIQLLRAGVGSSSSKLINVSWTGPTAATAYTGFEIDVNGGDVWLTGCTGIYGAIGCNIKQGQTIVLDKCSFNKQNIYSGHSNATQFNTAGIKLSGADYKQAISIRNSYIEACTNGIYVEACESLTIEDNLFFDSGASGVVGAYVQYGNSAINLGGTNSKNVTIKNNYIEALSNGDATTTFYALEFGDALNVQFDNNTVKTTGSYGGQWRVGASTTVTMRGNTKLQSGSNPQIDFDPANKIRFVVTGDALAGTWYSATLTAPSTHIASSPVKYRRDALGFVHLKGGVENAPSGGAILTLPTGFRPFQQEGFGVNASGGGGAVSVDTGGTIVLRGGTGTYVYLTGVIFSVT